MVATRDVAAGSTVFQERSTAFIVLNSYASDVCQRCLLSLTSEPRLCSACHISHWCSSTCQERDQTQHSLECEMLRDLPRISKEHSVDLDLLRIVLSISVRRYMTSGHQPTVSDAEVRLDETLEWRVTSSGPVSPVLYACADYEPLVQVIETPVECVHDIIHHLKRQDSKWVQSVCQGCKYLCNVYRCHGCAY
jgi:hypothetical protein